MSLLEAHKALAGKNAVILGGAFGVGRAITLALAESGINVAVCDNDAEAVGKIVPEVQAMGGKIFCDVVDVREADALNGFYDHVEAEFGGVDIIVNVPGGVKRMPFMDSTPEQNADVIRLNYGYVLDSFRRGIPLIRKGGRGGTIINFTTIEAHRGAATYSVYAGAKAATTNFGRAMAVELAAEGIRVTTIAPDTTLSRTSSNAISPETWARFAKLPPDTWQEGLKLYVPQKENPSERDLANAVLFLSSTLARSITGMTLHVDGGTMAAGGFLDWPFGDGFGPAPLAGTLDRLFVGGGRGV